MKIERHDRGDGDVYYTVLVDAGELICAGKPMPFSTWLGTIDLNGRINLWRPAGGSPRGYRPAAMAKLEEARDQLQREATSNGQTQEP